MYGDKNEKRSFVVVDTGLAQANPQVCVFDLWGRAYAFKPLEIEQA